jgi:hypothetical protein
MLSIKPGWRLKEALSVIAFNEGSNGLGKLTDFAVGEFDLTLLRLRFK